MRKFAAILPLLLIRPLAADNLSDVRAQMAAAKARNAEIADRLAVGERAAAATKKALVKTADELARLTARRETVADKIASLNKRRADLAAKIDATDEKLAEAAAALIAMSYGGNSFDRDAAMGYVLSGAILAVVSDQFDTDMKIAYLQMAEMEKLRDELEKQGSVYAEVEKKRRREHAGLADLLRDRASQNQELRARQSELRSRLADLAARARDLADLAARLEPGRSDAAKSVRGKLRLPAAGRLARKFGDRGESGVRSDGWRIRTHGGSIVQAPGDGRVEFADSFRGYNKIAIIRLDAGLHAVITGMESLSVMVGQEVLNGEPIGKMPELNPEIYLELRKAGRAVDPARLFAAPE